MVWGLKYISLNQFGSVLGRFPTPLAGSPIPFYIYPIFRVSFISPRPTQTPSLSCHPPEPLDPAPHSTPPRSTAVRSRSRGRAPSGEARRPASRAPRPSAGATLDPSRAAEPRSSASRPQRRCLPPAQRPSLGPSSSAPHSAAGRRSTAAPPPFQR